MELLDLWNVSASLQEAIPPVPVLRLEFDAQAVDRLPLPDFAGSSFRGLMGHTLKNIGCAVKAGLGGCDTCQVPWGCTYAYLFDTVAPLGHEPARGGEEMPRPFVLNPPHGQRVVEPGERFPIGLTLLGGGVQFLAHFLFCFEEMGRRGLGQVPARFRVLTCAVVRDDGSRELFYQGGFPRGHLAAAPEPDALDLYALSPDCSPFGVEVEFETPTRLVYRGNVVDEPPFHVLVRALLRRIDALGRVHARMSLDVDYPALIALAEEVETLASDARMYELHRRSNRQKRNLETRGVVGRVRYGSGAGAFFPLLRVGQVCHVGKSTTFGLGRYSIREVF